MPVGRSAIPDLLRPGMGSEEDAEPPKRRRKGGRAEGDLAGRRLDRRPRKITAAQRQALPASDFALPGHGRGPNGKGPGSYPIDTPGRARSALSRSAANATPAEQVKIRAAVHRKYPDIG